MATRRTSARLSGGSDTNTSTTSNNNHRVRVGQGGKSAGVDPKMINAKKRLGNGEDLGGGGGGGMGDAEKKKRRKEVKKQPAFKPQPIVLHSPDTPPDEEDEPIDLPPPPSERKIARRRESTRAIRERVSTSPTHDPKRKQGDGSKGSSTDRALGQFGRTDASSIPPVEFLTFADSSRPRPTGPRPSSPPRQPPGGPRRSMATMGPPLTTGFVRKTRKSMRGMGMDGLSTESVVPVPESETPMIRKNKELREAQQRRSSLGMRGQRASSSLGRGEISIPHTSVDSSAFYKHLAPTMPEPIRARHLIVWCAKRAADAEIGAKGKGKAKDRTLSSGVNTEEGDRLVKEIMEEFIASMGRGTVDTNVFAGGDSGSSSIHLVPHPRNAANREVKAKEEAVIKQCKEENYQWSIVTTRSNRKQAETVERTQAKQRANAEPSLSPADGWMVQALDMAEGVIAQGQGDLSAMGEFADVEFKVDTLLQTSHAALQYSQQAQRFLNGIFSSLTADLRSRDRAGLPTSIPGGTNHSETDGPDPVALLSTTRDLSSASSSATAGLPRRDPIFMLRALASTDAKSPNQESIAVAAAKVAPVQTGLNVSVGPGMGGATPRKTPKRG